MTVALPENAQADDAGVRRMGRDNHAAGGSIFEANRSGFMAGFSMDGAGSRP
jgi:hypothetical protein